MNGKMLRTVSLIAPIALILLAGLLAVGAQASFAQAQPVTIYVSTTGSDTTGTGSITAPYATIQHAVQVAPPHAIIIVEPGVYTGMVNITKTLTIESASMQPSNTILNAIGQTYGIEIIGQGASGTVIDGLTVEHANNHGIFVQDSSHVTIENNYVIYNGLNASKAIAENKGIELSGTSYSTVVNNFVANNMADGGIGVSDEGQINPGGTMPGTPAPAIGNVISGNVVTGNLVGCGIVVAAYNPGEGVIANVVSNNLVYNGLPGGIVVAADVPGTLAANNTVAYNTVLNNIIPGIIVHSNTPGDLVINTRIVGNVVSGNGGFGPQPTGIIVLANINGSTKAVDTVISGNVVHNEYFGVLVANATNTQVLADNSFDSTVTVPVAGVQMSTITLSGLASQVGSLQSSLSSVQNTVSQLQSSSSSAASQLSAIQSSLGSLQSSVSSTQGSVSSLQSQLSSLSSSVSTASELAYVAIALAVILGLVAIALALRK